MTVEAHNELLIKDGVIDQMNLMQVILSSKRQTVSTEALPVKLVVGQVAFPNFSVLF